MTDSPNGEPEAVDIEVPTVEVTLRFDSSAYDGMTDYAMERRFLEVWREQSRRVRREVLDELRRLRAAEGMPS